MTRISCVLFDLDGVLVDATEWHYEALNRALALFGFDITRYEHLSDYNGLPTRKKLQMLSVEKGLPAALHNTLSRLKQVYTRDEILTQVPSGLREGIHAQPPPQGGLPAGGLLEFDSREPADDGAAVRARRVFRVSREQRGRLAAETRSRNLRDGDGANGRRRRPRRSSSKTRRTGSRRRADRARTSARCRGSPTSTTSAFAPPSTAPSAAGGRMTVRPERRWPHDSDRRADGRRRPPVRRARLHLSQAARRGRRASRSSKSSSRTSRRRASTSSCSCAGRNTSRATRSATCLQLVAPGCRIVTMAKPTAGALCSVLLGMEYLRARGRTARRQRRSVD